MNKFIIVTLVICFLLTGCGNWNAATDVTETNVIETNATENISATAVTEKAVSVSKIYPLPDTIMDNLSDGILPISLEAGDVYVDDTGKMQMDVTIYSYDKFDMVDISMLKVGDFLVTHAGEMEVTTLARNENGTILINGGLDENGIDLITDETGVFYECGYSDAKNWYEIGEDTIQVSADFVYCDTSDLDNGEILYYPDSFLTGVVTDYYFTPYNTTIRVENSQIVEMYRVYIP